MKLQRLIIIGAIVLVFLAFLTTFTVRFNERAVVTTLGKAGEGSVISKPGLNFKWPPPLQDVVKYDARVRFIQADQETQQTLDKSQVLVTAYLTWRVEDPLKFYQNFSGNSGENERAHYREAEKILKGKLRSSMNAVSKYRFDELFTSDPSGSKIAALEAEILSQVTSGGATPGSGMASSGIKAVSVGIVGLALPTGTTKDVFERMKSARLKVSNDAISQGKSMADTIKSGADADVKKITSFAEQLATRIRNQGDVEAAKFLEQLRDDPKLAVFLENMRFLRQAMGSQTTLVLPTSMPGLELFRPDASKNFRAGEVPSPNFDNTGAEKKRKAATSGAGATSENPTTEKTTMNTEGSR